MHTPCMSATRQTTPPLQHRLPGLPKCFLPMLCCVCNPHLFVHYHTPHIGSSAFMGVNFGRSREGPLLNTYGYPNPGACTLRWSHTAKATTSAGLYSSSHPIRPTMVPLQAIPISNRKWVQFFPKVDMVSKPNMGNKLLCPWAPNFKAVATSTTISYPILKTEHVTYKDDTLTEGVHGFHGILNWFRPPLP